MVQNSKPKSVSSASHRKKAQLERAHKRSRRQVRPSTPKVLSDDSRSGPQAITVAQQRERNRRAGVRTGVSAGKATGKTAAKTSGSTSRRSTGSQNTSQGSRSDYRGTTGARKQAQTKRVSRFRLKLIVAAVALVALVALYITLYNSSFLKITDIQTNGNFLLKSEHIVDLAAAEDSTFLRVDTDTITQNLATDPWIQSVSVSRVFPSTLVLNITERPIAAVVDIVPEKATDKTSHWLISDDGTWIANLNAGDETTARLTAEQQAKIIKIKDVSAAVRPQSGDVTTDAGLINALEMLNGFSPEMRAMVTSVSAPDKVKTTLVLSNNVGVAFGAAEDIQAKEDAIATLLEEHKGKLTYINVRVANRATFRATE